MATVLATPATAMRLRRGGATCVHDGAAVGQLAQRHFQQVWQRIMCTLKTMCRDVQWHCATSCIAWKAASTSPAPAACRSSAVT